MRLLLDSHALLWWVEAVPDRLNPNVRVNIDSADAVYGSAATVWELEIKRNAGKLSLGSLQWTMLDGLSTTVIAIDRDDALAAARLPPLHRDPFDRMIVAQAIRRDLTLVTVDRALSDYGVAILKA